MNLANTVSAHGMALNSTPVNPLLNGDMSFRFELQVALARVLAVVVLECALDVDGMCIVSFDQVAVITIHRTHQAGECAADAFRQTPPESSRLGGKVNSQIGQFAALPSGLTDEQRLHQTDVFAPVDDRFDVRFDVRFR